MSLRFPTAFLVLPALLFEPLFAGPCLADDSKHGAPPPFLATFTEFFEEALSDPEPPKTVETPAPPTVSEPPSSSPQPLGFSKKDKIRRMVRHKLFESVKPETPEEPTQGQEPLQEDKAVFARRFNFGPKPKSVSALPKTPPAERARISRQPQPSVIHDSSRPDQGASPRPKANFSPRPNRAAPETPKPRPAISVSPAKVPQIKYVPTTVKTKAEGRRRVADKRFNFGAKPRKPAAQKPETISIQPPVADHQPEIPRRARIEAALARVREIKARTPAAQRILDSTSPPRQASKMKKAELARAILAKHGLSLEQSDSTS